MAGWKYLSKRRGKYRENKDIKANEWHENRMSHYKIVARDGWKQFMRKWYKRTTFYATKLAQRSISQLKDIPEKKLGSSFAQVTFPQEWSHINS